MTETKKLYDLEERTRKFARCVREFIPRIPGTIANNEDARQLVRSSGSVGANYIEANEALSKKDFIMRIKICRKEAKESMYWLSLFEFSGQKTLEVERKSLLQEATELMMIFGAILRKSDV